MKKRSLKSGVSMLKSMTAYAQASFKGVIGRITVEIQSVNRKFLEINTFLPKELMSFDSEIKKWIGELILRGQINCRIFVEYDKVAPWTVKANLPLVRQLKKAWDEISKELEITQDFKLELLLQEKDIFLYKEEFGDREVYKQAIEQALFLALDELVKMKKTEGIFLLEDIKMRLENIKQSVDQIELQAPQATAKYRERLISNLNEVLPGFIENEERILREVCLFAEKVDIAEEITRLKSHLKQFYDLLIKDSATIGKTLEFVIQEMNRETNTIGSKTSLVEVSKLVIEMKGELERIREQIQNVE